MDAQRFDGLVRVLATPGPRRNLARFVTMLPLVGALTMRRGDDAAAVNGRRKRRKKRHQHQKGDDKRNRKGKRKGQGTSRTQDCPDTTISCFKVLASGTCDVLVGSFGPVGTCYQFPSCCPCDHPDADYWINRCNQTFPDCGGKCIAQDDLSSLLRCIWDICR